MLIKRQLIIEFLNPLYLLILETVYFLEHLE